MILAVDPGDTSGFALFAADGSLINKWQSNFDNSLEFLSPLTNLKTIVVEDYRLRAGKQAQQTGSRFQAVQMIGALKYHAKLHGMAFELASVQAKTLGAMFSGQKPPSNHKESHEVDAYNIGIYWLVDNKIIEPPSLKDL
jgi:hypothetical protein